MIDVRFIYAEPQPFGQMPLPRTRDVSMEFVPRRMETVCVDGVDYLVHKVKWLIMKTQLGETKVIKVNVHLTPEKDK